MKKQTKQIGKTATRPAKKSEQTAALEKSAGAPALVGASPSESCRQTVLECIGRQSGGRDLSGNPTLGAVGVQGFLLAGCINEAFGLTPPDAFSASDFPSTMTVLECIALVCQTVD